MMRFLAFLTIPILAGLIHLLLGLFTSLNDLFEELGKGEAVNNHMQKELSKLADQIGDLNKLSPNDVKSLAAAFQEPAKEVKAGEQAGRKISCMLIIAGSLLAFPAAWLIRIIFKISAVELITLSLLIPIGLHLAIAFFVGYGNTDWYRLTEFGKEVHLNTNVGKVRKLFFWYYPALLITLWAISDEAIQAGFWQTLFMNIGTIFQGNESLISIHEAMMPIYIYGYPIIGSLALIFGLRVIFLRWVFGKRVFKVVVYKPKEQRQYQTAYYQCGKCGKRIVSRQPPSSCPHCGVSFGYETKEYDTPPKPTVRRPPKEITLTGSLTVTIIFLAVTLVFVASVLAVSEGQKQSLLLTLVYNAIPAVIALFAARNLAGESVDDEVTIEQEIYYEGNTPPT